MPIIVEPLTNPITDTVAIVRLPGLPDFNTGRDFIADIPEWYDTSAASPVLVANGGGPGAIAVPQEHVEAYYTLTGQIDGGDPVGIRMLRRLMLAAFPAGAEAAVVVLEPDGTERQAFVWGYDKPSLPILDNRIVYTLPLVAPDPYKYALEPLSGTVGVFSGVGAYRTYTAPVAPARAYRTYTPTGTGRGFRVYTSQGDTGPYPLEWGAVSDGDATSRRVVATISGPQPSGWWVERQDESNTVAERLWVDQALAPTQTVVLDCQPPYSATLNGADVSHLTFGDFLTLPGGRSTFRLVAPTDLGGSARFDALPAYL